MNKIILSFAALLLVMVSNSQDNNAALQKMADEDQQARNNSAINWAQLHQEDSLRRVRVLELMEQKQLKTGKDYLNAGIIFQHGNDTISSALAVKSFQTALSLDSTLNRWWYAAAVDRDRMRRNQPQIYGTQFITDQATGKWKRYTIDPTVITDEERSYYYVETLAAQEEKERLMNQKTITAHYAETKSIDKTITAIKIQHQQGTLSAYNVSEEAINNFGYSLLNQHKQKEALKIFELNTKLYPNAFNTFDSYGEMLLKMNKKKKSIRAYKQSLKLNPQNENARKVLQTINAKN